MTETLTNNRHNPCKGCQDRYTACSDHCQKPEFLAWKAEQAKIRAAKRAYREPVWINDSPYDKRRKPGKRERR